MRFAKGDALATILFANICSNIENLRVQLQ